MTRTWRIGEVAERTGLTRRTLRHYDELGLLVPSARSHGDYRLYDTDDLLRLLQIQNLKAIGLGLTEIAEALADPELDATVPLRSHLAHLEQAIDAQRQLAERLRRLVAAPERSWDDVLTAIAMTQALSHPDPTVRIRAALERTTHTTTELLAALDSEPDEGVREVLLWSLSQQPDAAPAAVERLRTADPGVTALLARLLGKLRERAAVPDLVALVDHDDPAVATAAVRALGTIGDPATAGTLVALLPRDSLATEDVVEALAGLGPNALDPLLAALTDPSPRGRAAAAEAVGRLAPTTTDGDARRSAEALAPLLDDIDPHVRLSAVMALGDLGPFGREALARGLGRPELAPVVRRLLDLHVT